MSEAIVVGISDWKASTKKDEVFVTYALGSCVGICLRDKVSNIGGLSHIMLPYSKEFKDCGELNRMKFADTAILDMYKQLVKLGAKPENFTAKIAGGANMFQSSVGGSMGNIGQRNVAYVKEVLKQLKVPIIAEDTGLNYGRTVFFDLATNVMKVQSLGKEIKEL